MGRKADQVSNFHFISTGGSGLWKYSRERKRARLIESGMRMSMLREKC